MKPQVKPTEKSRVLVTKDYSMFEFPDVKVSKKFLELIKDSIREKNLLPDFPVIVDDYYRIIDGKYKFLACYELKMPVHYKIAEVATISDIVRIKELMKKASLSQIIEIHKDKEPYMNCIHIHQFFRGFFKYNEILCCVDGMLKNSFKYVSGGCGGTAARLMLDRYKVASGKMSDFNVNTVIKRLTTLKYLVDEFNIAPQSALAIFYSVFKFEIDFVVSGKLIRQAQKLHQETWTQISDAFDTVIEWTNEGRDVDSMINNEIKEFNEDPYVIDTKLAIRNK